jgi:hypothetical protein
VLKQFAPVCTRYVAMDIGANNPCLERKIVTNYVLLSQDDLEDLYQFFEPGHAFLFRGEYYMF